MTNELKALEELRAEIRQRETAIIDAAETGDTARLIHDYIDWANEVMGQWEENGAGEEALCDFIFWAEERLD